MHKDRNNFRLFFPRKSAKIIGKIIYPFSFNPKFIPVETDPANGGGDKAINHTTSYHTPDPPFGG